MKKIIYFIAAGLAMSLSSCVSLDTPPMDSDTDLTFWTKPSAAEQTVNSCYQYMEDAGTVLYADAASDNAYCKVQNIIQAIGNGSYSTGDSYIKSYWDNRYTGIKLCNRLTDNIDKIVGMEEGLRNRCIGEAKCIRAYHYFQLVSRFGDVPYFTSVLPIADAGTIARTPKAEVIKNILQELDEAAAVLPASYSGDDQGRFTKWAAIALKARIQLYEGNWAEVETLTNDIINSGAFKLFGSYEGLFESVNKRNQEVILDVEYAPMLREQSLQYNFIPPTLGGYAQLVPLQELVDSYIMLNGKSISESGSGFDSGNEFADRDPRLAATICYTGNSYNLAGGKTQTIDCSRNASPDGLGFSSNCSPSGYYFKKYWDKDFNTNNNLASGMNIYLIRYADVLLMNAEAAAEQGKLTNAVWSKTIRPIRERAGFTEASALDFPSASGSELINIVRNERRCELAFEGLRMGDIYRWKTAEKVLSGWCHGAWTGETVNADNGYIQVERRQFDASRHYLWAIPQQERDLNSALTQNPNW
ncbi:MAG: RagB/SusD family nutrient uptake outer membrane protein [Bacteroidales bacterium]|nr:RagB/SusD family nutrient uptake outer membrane protein [Bacteroidales bacterium]